MSFSQVADLAQAVKLDYQLVKRDPGTLLPVPAVMHWKLGHYSALLDYEDGYYLTKDSLLSHGMDAFH